MSPGLFGLLKLAAPTATKLKFQEKLDLHFDGADRKKWPAFRRELRSKGFLEAVKKDNRADPKLKRFAEMVHLHKTGKGPTFPVKSESGKRYVVKYHPERNIYSCSCPDWTIVKSQSAGECKHIKQVKSQSSMVKKAAFALRELAGLGRAGLQSYRTESHNEQAWHAGQVNKIHKSITQDRKLRRMG
jgi:hypothetical protein